MSRNLSVFIEQISSDLRDWSLNIGCQVTEIISTDQRSGSSRIIGVEILSAQATQSTILSKLQTLPCHSQIQLFISYCFSMIKIELVTVMVRTRPALRFKFDHIIVSQNFISKTHSSTKLFDFKSHKHPRQAKPL